MAIVSETQEVRACTKCGERTPPAEFYEGHAWCKTCVKKAAAESARRRRKPRTCSRCGATFFWGKAHHKLCSACRADGWKVCSRCDQAKASGDFYVDKSLGQGRTADCKVCREAARRERTGAVPRSVPPKGMRCCCRCRELKSLDAFHGDKHKPGGKGYYCKECVRVINQEQRRKHLSRILAYSEDYRRQNLERFAQKAANRRARQRAGYVEDVDRLALLEMDDGQCGICGTDVDPLEFVVDHRIPIEKGGEHSYVNTQVAHRKCNGKKGKRLPWEQYGNGPDFSWTKTVALLEPGP
jgi:5-methylcytosine-specific restriction endonuclease McrA